MSALCVVESYAINQHEHLTKATALCPNLYRRGEVPINRDGGVCRLNLPEDALYVLLE